MDFTPYLIFNGNCREAFQFYEKVFGGKITGMMTFGETPAKEHAPPEFHDKVIHVHMKVGERSLMGSDAPPGRFSPPQGIHVSVDTKTVADARRLFDALAEGGKVEMAFEKTFWSPGFGMVVDRFGTPWMVGAAAETVST